MIHTQTQAQLYLAEQRGYSQTDFFRSDYCFNFGSYFDESRKSFGALQVFNENTLKAGSSIPMRVEANTQVILVPVVGGLEYKSDFATSFLEPGQVQVFSFVSGMAYEIINPYEHESIHFIQICFTNASTDRLPISKQIYFDLTTKNTLLPIFGGFLNEKKDRGFIGKYEGRTEGIHQVDPSNTGVFVFILTGVFEVANRLLHEKDGLALQALPEGIVEFEALSNDAILILLEVPLER